MHKSIIRCRVGLPCLLLGGAVALSGCGARRTVDPVRETVKNEVKAAKDRFSGVTAAVMKESQLSGGDEQGRPLWSVGAKEIRVLESKSESEPRRAQLTDARATVYRDGKPESTFRAARAELIYKEEETGARISLSGNVRASTAGPWVGQRGPVTIETPRLEVNATERRLWSNQGVRVTQGTGQQTVVTARQINADASIKVARLMGNVKAASAQGVITADQAVWNWEKERAAANGHVTASHEGTTVSGARLDADTSAQRGVLSGGVRATSANGQASAATVRFNWSARTLAASGGVTLTKDGATLRAASLNTDDKLNHATAHGDVRLHKGDVLLRAARIAAFDKMARAEASGGVTLHKGNVTLRADRATSFDNMQRAIATGDVTLIRNDLTITAARAEVSGITKNGASRITASGNVFARSNDGSVRASNLTWGSGRVTATGGVTLRKEGNVLTGARLESDDRFKEAVLSGSVQGRLAQGETVAAGTLIWRNGRVLGRNGVSARRGVLTLRGNQLDATADGNHVTVTGNVVVKSGDGKTLRAPTVRYDKKTGKVFASGGVQFSDTQRGMQLRGKTLVANLKLQGATLTEVSGSGDMELFKGKKLF